MYQGSLFEIGTNPPAVILKLIYHWSCQTNIPNVSQWVKVKEYTAPWKKLVLGFLIFLNKKLSLRRTTEKEVQIRRSEVVTSADVGFLEVLEAVFDV